MDYQAIRYYSAPKMKEQLGSLDEVDPEVLKTFEKLGISLNEQARCDSVIHHGTLLQHCDVRTSSVRSEPFACLSMVSTPSTFACLTWPDASRCHECPLMRMCHRHAVLLRRPAPVYGSLTSAWSMTSASPALRTHDTDIRDVNSAEAAGEREERGHGRRLRLGVHRDDVQGGAEQGGRRVLLHQRGGPRDAGPRAQAPRQRGAQTLLYSVTFTLTASQCMLKVTAYWRLLRSDSLQQKHMRWRATVMLCCIIIIVIPCVPAVFF